MYVISNVPRCAEVISPAEIAAPWNQDEAGEAQSVWRRDLFRNSAGMFNSPPTVGFNNVSPPTNIDPNRKHKLAQTWIHCSLLSHATANGRFSTILLAMQTLLFLSTVLLMFFCKSVYYLNL